MIPVAALLFYILICLLVSLAGKGKSIGFWGTFFLSLFLSPLIGLIIALASGSKTQYVPQPVNIYQQQMNQQPPTNYPPQYSQMNQVPQVQPQQTSIGGNEKYAQIEKLADMKSKGILTEDEFQKEKSRILGQ